MGIPQKSVGYSMTASGTNSDWAAALEIDTITLPGKSVGSLRTSHQGTTTAHTYVAQSIPEGGELNVKAKFNSDELPVIGGANQDFIIAFPGDVSLSTKTISGFIMSYEPDGEDLDGIMMATAVIKVSGDEVDA